VGSVPREWLVQHALAPGRIDLDEGEFLSADDVTLRRRFEREHADLLVDHGMDHLDVSEVRSRDRIVTQTFGRFLYDLGAAGILYRSNLDDLPCLALFEGRALLTLDGELEALADLPPALLQVCDEFGLTCSAGSPSSANW